MIGERRSRSDLLAIEEIQIHEPVAEPRRE